MNNIIEYLWQTINHWDGVVTRFLNVNLGSHFLDRVMIFFTLLGNGFSAIIILALAVYFLSRDEAKGYFKKNFFKGAAAMLLSGILVQVIKFFVNRHRPFEHIDGLRVVWEHVIWRSFPSGHTATAFALAGFLHQICIMKKLRMGWILWAVAVIIGVSRIYTGVHYPTDVLAGAIVGLLSARIIIVVFNVKNTSPSSDTTTTTH